MVKRALPGWRAGLAAALFCAAPADAVEPSPEGEPLWEVGIGGFALDAPDYPASAERATNGLVLPYAVYRGRVLRLDDDDGARIVPVETPRFRLSLSANAAFGAQSDSRGAREGMPDLDPLVELGPELILLGPRFGPPDRRARLDFALQARAVASVDFDGGSTRARGAVLEPAVQLRWSGVAGRDSDLRASLGAVFATEALHDFFYGVDPAFARPGRPAFDAAAGYLGTDLVVSLSRDLSRRLSAFAGVIVSSHAGAANADSPLFEEELTGSAFAGLVVRLGESRRRVAARD